MRSLDYLYLIYGPKHKLDINLLYILPALPPLLTDKKTMDKRIRAKLKTVEKKNIQMAERILSEAKAAALIVLYSISLVPQDSSGQGP
jgi:hypothetical protein